MPQRWSDFAPAVARSQDNAMFTVVLQPPLATSARLIEKDTGVDWLRVNMQAHTAIARFLEILDLVRRQLSVDYGDPPVGLKSRAIQRFHFHWAYGDAVICAARSRLVFVPIRPHESIITATQFTLHNS
jgi:hypothetical protein